MGTPSISTRKKDCSIIMLAYRGVAITPVSIDTCTIHCTQKKCTKFMVFRLGVLAYRGAAIMPVLIKMSPFNPTEFHFVSKRDVRSVYKNKTGA